MAYNRTQVRSLLNASELALFEASLAGPVKELTTAQLRAKVSRTRALRDKYQDLLRRQKLATRQRTGSKSGAGVTADANKRTEQKMVALAEVLARFEKRLEQNEATQARAAEKTAAAAERLAALKQRTVVPKRSAAKPTPAPRAARKSAAVVLRELVGKKPPQGADEPGQPPRLSKKAPAHAPESGAPALGPTAESARAARFESQQWQAGGQRIQGHVGTQVRRAQSKRDSRG